MSRNDNTFTRIQNKCRADAWKQYTPSSSRSPAGYDSPSPEPELIPGRMYAFWCGGRTNAWRFRELKSAKKEWCYADDTGQRHLKESVRELTEDEWKKLQGET